MGLAPTHQVAMNVSARQVEATLTVVAVSIPGPTSSIAPYW